MPDLPSRVELFDIGVEEIRDRSDARRPENRVDPEQAYVEGSDMNIVTASASAMAEEVVRQLSLKVAALMLDSADADDLDRLVADRFSPTIVRKTASPAVGDVQFTRVTGGFPAITVALGTKLKTPSGIEYLTTVAVSLGVGSSGPVTAPVQSSVAGLSSNVAARTITTFDPPFSADPSLLVTNVEPTAGGDDTERDSALRARARAFFRTVRRGTLGAIEFGALTVAGVRQAVAVEEIEASTGDQSGRVSLFIADAQGQGNAALVAAVRAILVEYRGAGVVVDVFGATPIFVAIKYRLRFEAGVDSTVAFAQIQFATLVRVNALRPVETLTVALLFEAARTVPGVIVLDDAVLEPIGDLIPESGFVIRTRDDLVTAE